MNPLALSGFNSDIIVEATAASPYSAFAASFDGGPFAWYERGLPGSTKGLPAGGSFTSVSDGSIRGQFQPYSGPNALVLTNAANIGTLTLDASSQIAYDAITVFASSGGGGGTGTLVLEFVDGTASSNINFTASDWFFVTTNNALNNLGRANLTNNTPDDASLNNPRIYQTVINLSTLGLNTKAIREIRFTKPAAGNATAVFAVSGQRALTALTPVSASGWNRDLVVENAAVVPYAPFAQSFDTFNGFALYERGLSTSTKGLPTGGAFTSLSSPAVQGQFQPFDMPNALFLEELAPSATLTLTQPAKYEFLAVFASSTNGGGTGSAILNFTDGSASSPVNFNASDWFNVTSSNALNNLGRVSLATDAFDDSGTGNPRIYQTVIDLAAFGLDNRTLASVTFTKPNFTGAQNTAVWGLSGQASATPACPADFTGDGTLNIFDILAFFNLFAGNDPTADFNSDGNLNIFDILTFFNLFAAGCP